MRVKALARRVRLDVEHAVLDRGTPVRELLLRRREEPGRNVRERVIEPSRRERAEHRCCRAPGPGPDLQHAQGTIFGQARRRSGNGVGNDAVRRPQRRRVPVQLCGPDPVSPEQQPHGIRTPPEDVGQGLSATSEQVQFNPTVRMPLTKCFQELPGVCGKSAKRRGVRSQDGGPFGLAGGTLIEQPSLCQQVEEAKEQPLVIRNDVQFAPQIVRLRSLVRHVPPAQLLQGRPGVRLRQALEVFQQAYRFGSLDTFFGKIRVEVVHNLSGRSRTRQETGVP